MKTQEAESWVSSKVSPIDPCMNTDAETRNALGIVTSLLLPRCAYDYKQQL
jgi:hypothetical protein